MLSGIRLPADRQRQTDGLKPRLHQIHVTGYKYPGRATCIRLYVDGYKKAVVDYSPIQVDACIR